MILFIISNEFFNVISIEEFYDIYKKNKHDLIRLRWILNKKLRERFENSENILLLLSKIKKKT